MRLTTLSGPASLPVDARMLALCNQNLAVGHSAEVAKSSQLTLTITRLAGRNGDALHEFIVTLLPADTFNAPIQHMRVRGRLIDCSEGNAASGFPAIAHALIGATFTIPSAATLPSFTAPLPAYHQLAQARAVIGALSLLPREPEHQALLLRAGFLKADIQAGQTPKRTPGRRTTFVSDMQSFTNLFKYNSKILARFSSAHPQHSLRAAQHLLLNIAALNALTPQPEACHIALATSMEVLEIPHSLLQQLRTHSEQTTEAIGRVSLITQQALRMKMPVFKLTQTIHLQQALCAAGLAPTHRNADLFVLFNTEDHIIVTNLVSTRSQATPHNIAAQLARSELLARRWLAAACAAHPPLHPLQASLSAALAARFKSHVSYPACPALDFWHAHTSNENQ